MDFFGNHTGLVMGLLLLAAGIAAGCFPQWMTSYRYLPPKKQEHVDLKGLGRHMFFGLGLLGFLILGIDQLPANEAAISTIRMTVLFVGVLLVLGTAQRFDHNKE